jgi:hypothetical protein
MEHAQLYNDYLGLTRALAEEISFRCNSSNDFWNWLRAEDIIKRFESKYLKEYLKDRDNMVDLGLRPKMKLFRELISARAERIFELNHNDDSSANWLQAQKEVAIDLYLMNHHSEERKQLIRDKKNVLEDLEDYNRL